MTKVKIDDRIQKPLHDAVMDEIKYKKDENQINVACLYMNVKKDKDTITVELDDDAAPKSYSEYDN